jgi:hypothetical protein
VGYATAKWAADGRPTLVDHALLLSWKPAATASLIGAAARPVEADVAPVVLSPHAARHELGATTRSPGLLTWVVA